MLAHDILLIPVEVDNIDFPTSLIKVVYVYMLQDETLFFTIVNKNPLPI